VPEGKRRVQENKLTDMHLKSITDHGSEVVHTHMTCENSIF